MAFAYCAWTLKAQRVVEKNTRAGERETSGRVRAASDSQYTNLPRAAKTFKEVLEENMTLTVEPGIYVPGWGDCRHRHCCCDH